MNAKPAQKRPVTGPNFLNGSTMRSSSTCGGRPPGDEGAVRVSGGKFAVLQRSDLEWAPGIGRGGSRRDRWVSAYLCIWTWPRVVSVSLYRARVRLRSGVTPEPRPSCTVVSRAFRNRGGFLGRRFVTVDAPRVKRELFPIEVTPPQRLALSDSSRAPTDSHGSLPVQGLL